ncbi:FAD-binding oxidoreductase [bacterium]|nr:FAD-binding oxidoreductase [bacterium]
MEPTLRVIHGGKEPARELPAEPPPSELSGWGMYPRVQGRQRLSENLERITEGATLTRGLGRSYGDASLPGAPGATVAGSVLADRLLAFDRETGLVRAEAGVTLMRLNRLSLPRGWFVPVTPGTHWVTLGGMVAADVHGKNHHVAGTFGEHVRSLRLRLADGRRIEVSDEHERALFRATLGGMGLTGHILEVTFQMARVPSPWIWQESEQVASFEAILERLADAGRDWPYTVCWNDLLNDGPGLGRGLIVRGRWAEPGEAPARRPPWRSAPTLPLLLPSWALQPWMVRVHNLARYLAHGARVRHAIAHPETFFYPLDVVREWNRLYGRRGFIQYQAVLPGPHDHPRHRQLIATLRRRRGDVYLCVIKDCGAEGRGLLSFPRPGVSYALDLPVGRGTQSLVDALNELVIAEGGRIYLAKDALTRAEHFRAMERDRLPAFQAVRDTWDPERRLKSALSVRLFGDAP